MRRRCLVFAPVFALCGCINGDLHLYEAQVTGTVSLPGSGTLHLEFHHSFFFGPSALAHPLGLIDTREQPASGPVYALDETILYPTQKGQGLVVYGWLDLDGDGTLCAPGKTEPAGLAMAEPFPAHQTNLSLTLNQNCAGPENLYP